MSGSANISWVFIELGIVIIGLAVLARFASRLGLSAIPLYLLAGLAFGNGGLLPLRFSEEFVHTGAEIGTVLLLFMLGLEHSGKELSDNLRTGLPAGLADFLLNFTPGLVAGFLLGWSPLASVLLGGVTYPTSSGIIGKVLADMGRMHKPEVATVIAIAVMEDLANAVYLPLMAVLLIGQGFTQGLIAIGVALLTVLVVLVIAVRYGHTLSRVIWHTSDEITLLTVLGIILLVAGAAQQLQISAAIGAFLVGVALSGPIVEQTLRLLSPLRDLFAAIFFLFFGLQIDPSSLPPVLLPAAALGVVTTFTKIATGWWAARRSGESQSDSLRAGLSLVVRGEFSILIAGLGAALEPALIPLSASYVLLLAVVGPLLLKFAELRIEN